MPRAPAKKKVRMCAKCNGDFIDKFEKLLGSKENVVFEKKCVGGGKCGTKTPFCKVEQGANKNILEAGTVEELAAMV